MRLTSRDIYHLRWNLRALVALVLVGGGSLFALQHLTRQEEKTTQQIQAQGRDIQARLARAKEEEAEIRQKISRYREIEARGLIGQEHRLEWVERIAQVKNTRRLIDIQYELAPQKPLDAAILPASAGAGGHEFVASTMKLQMQLLHEEDLFGFLDDLAGTVKAFLHVKSCKIERLPRPDSERGPVAQLKTECLIDWVTLREKP